MSFVVFAIVLGLLAPLALHPAPAHSTPASSRVFFENFEDCTQGGNSEFQSTARGEPPGIQVNLFTTGTVDCPGWTSSGQAWLATYVSGIPFPSPVQAIWLNEGGVVGKIEREITGLQIGSAHRIEVKTWTDNVDDNTQLGVDVVTRDENNVPTTQALRLDLAAGSGIQSLGTEFCALQDNFSVALFQSLTKPASPIIDDVEVTDLGVSCTTFFPDSDLTFPPFSATVTFEPNGGEGTMADQVSSEPRALSSVTFIREGFDFAGWNTSSDGSGTAFSNGQTYSFQANLTLYAQWSASPSRPKPSPPKVIDEPAPEGDALAATGASTLPGLAALILVLAGTVFLAMATRKTPTRF